MTSGQLLSDVNKTIYFSSEVNGTGLVNPTSMHIVDWVDNYASLVNYYSCSNIYTSTCTEKKYLIKTTKYNFQFINGEIFDFDTPSRARLRRPPQPRRWVSPFCIWFMEIVFLIVMEIIH